MDQRDDKRLIFKGEWRRFSNYEITNGYIRPTKDAKLEHYDPWEKYHSQRFGGASGTAPWEVLYKIGWEIERQDGNEELLCSEKVTELILAFCKEYGLLGILLQQVHQVVFPTRMGYVSGYLAEKWQKEGMTYDEAWAKRPITTLYHRDCLGGWAQVRNIQVDQDETSVGERSCPPGVLLQPILDQSDLKMQEIRTTWAKYFPDVHETDWETYQTPVPTDPEFWTGYAEPVECFLSSARLVFEICHGLHEDKRNRRSAIVQLLGSLSTLTASIRPFFYYARGEYKVGWKSPSLLAIVFMMLGTDLAGRYRFIGCSNCGYIFLTKSYRGKYCSEKCKNGFHRRPASLRPDTEQTKRTA